MEIKPFKAFRFDAAVVGDVGDCIAPPYDVIDSARQQQLYEKSEYNIVRIIKGKTCPSDNGDNNQYTRAADYLNNWTEKGALKQDPAETIYAYIQDFQLAGSEFERSSFIVLAKLEEFGQIVRPHEQVFNEPIVDRLNLNRATSAMFGLPFCLYEDRQGTADRIISDLRTPIIDCKTEIGNRKSKVETVRHRLFAITAKEDTGAIVQMMSDKSCIIADGHHRYTTGLTYAKESGKAAAQYQMMAFANTRQEGLVVLATHRLVGNLETFNIEKLIAELSENFEVTKLQFDSPETKTHARQQALAQMKAEFDNDRNAFGLYCPDNAFYVAVLKDKRTMDSLVPNMSSAWRSLDVSILHKLILEGLLGIDEDKLAEGGYLQYVKDTPNAIDESTAQVDAGQKQAAFFMNPLKMRQLIKVTDAGERMPQKSTYFYPKIFTGLTINKL